MNKSVDNTTVTRRFLKSAWIVMAIVIVSAAVLSSIARFMTPWLSQYKPQVILVAQKNLKRPISVGEMKAGWYWFQPVVKFNNVEIFSKDQSKTILKIDKIQLGIDIWQSLWHWQIQPGLLIIEGAKITLSKKILKNTKAEDSLKDVVGGKSNYAKFLLQWLMRQNVVVLKNINLKYVGDNGSIIPLTHLYLKIVNDDGYHFIEGKARLEQTIPTKVKLLGRFDGDNPSFEDWDGEMYLSVQNLLLAQWLAHWKFSNFNITNGLANFNIWLNLQSGKLKSIQGQLLLKQLGLKKNSISRLLMIQKLSMNLSWEKLIKGWRFTADEVSARISGKTYPMTQLLVENKKRNWLFYLNTFDLSLLNEIASFLPDRINFINDSIVKFKPKGLLHNVKLRVSNHLWKYFSSKLEGVSIHEGQAYPGIEGITGHFYASPQQGHMDIKSTNGALSIQSAFQNRLPFNQLTGTLDWVRKNDRYLLSVEHLLFSDENITLTSHLNADIYPNFEDSLVNLESHLSTSPMHSLKQYLPQKIMKPKLYNWLMDGFVKANSITAKLNLKGRLKDFPFENNMGMFVVDSHINGLALNYKQQWPQAENIDAHLLFKKREMMANVKSATILNVPLKEVRLSIQDLGLGRENLDIIGNIAVHSKNIIKFVQQSPLHDKLSVLDGLNIKGDSALDLYISIPLYPENDDIIVKGKIGFIKNSVKFKNWWGLKLTNLVGDLVFNQDGILDSNINGELFEETVDIKMHTSFKPHKSTLVNVDGTFSIDSIKRIFSFPILNFAKGNAKFNLLLNLYDNPKLYDEIQFTSLLQGIKIDLPQPFGKPSNRQKKLSVKAKLADAKNSIISMLYSNIMSGVLSFAKSGDITSGDIRIGSKKPIIHPNNKGIRVIGSIDTFTLNDWLPYVEQFSKLGKKHTQLWSNFSYMDVRVLKANLLGQAYSNLDVKVNPDPGKWLIKLSNDQINGQIEASTKAAIPLKVRFKTLNVNPVNTNDYLYSQDLLPSEFLALDVMVEQLKYKNIPLGTLKLVTSSNKEIYDVKEVSLISPNYNLKFGGYWKFIEGKNITEMEGYFLTKKLAKALQQWGLTPVMNCKNCELTFRLNWNKPLLSLNMADASGDIKLKMERGNISHLSKEAEEKIGLGKLISILSLQTLPRRLVLDFSDLSNKGFSFDILKGTYRLNEGKATTKDSYLDGPVAYISMKGSLNLAKQQYDLLLRVNPHITASLPIVATIAGGPIAGVATWVASKIINTGMRQVTGYTYKISGPWSKPIVQQISITEAKKR